MACLLPHGLDGGRLVRGTRRWSSSEKASHPGGDGEEAIEKKQKKGFEKGKMEKETG